MNKYIVLLRGINVGGRNKLPMADLRIILSNYGYKNVTTYIQSGNILLNSIESIEKINENIKRIIKQHFDYEIPIVTLTTEELKKCFVENPYLKIEDNIKNLHVTFLKNIPENYLVENIKIKNANNDSYTIIGKTIYLHMPDGYQNTKFSNTLFEKKLKTQATTRNWRTTTKLFEMIIAN